MHLKGAELAAKGKLYVVSTPIGNLEDITLRALRVLSEVDLIAAEDTRRTRVLLKHFDIKTPVTSYFDFNKEKKAPLLVGQLLKGKSIAIVSNAGTPGISDPAFFLVRKAIQEGIEITSIPGPTAFVAALVISGLPTDRFVFEGFLPHKKGRKKRLEQLAEERRTIILYESPHRLLRTLEDIKRYLGDRSIVVAREITKKFEEVLRGSTTHILEVLSQRRPRGEVVIIIQGKG